MSNLSDFLDSLSGTDHVPNPTPERFMQAVALRKELQERSDDLFEAARLNLDSVATPAMEIYDHTTVDRLLTATHLQGVRLTGDLDKEIIKWAFDEPATADLTVETLQEMIDGILDLQRAYLALQKVHNTVVDQHTMTHDKNNGEGLTAHP